MFANAHPDFGSGEWPPASGAPIGIPYIEVDGAPLIDVSFGYASESEPGPYPIPPNAPIEGGPKATGDRHVLVVDRSDCMLYELSDARRPTPGSWTAESGATFDLKSTDLRPSGWRSKVAAGLEILPGLIRYDEVATGEISHESASPRRKRSARSPGQPRTSLRALRDPSARRWAPASACVPTLTSQATILTCR